jgi:hypothetical protein
MNKTIIGIALSVLSVVGCKQPRLSYDVRADLRAPGLDALSLDPRKDLAVVLEGQQRLEPGPVRELVLKNLQAKGFRLVPQGEAAVWLEVLVLAPGPGHAGGGPLAKGGEAPGGGREGHGGRGGGGSRKTHGDGGQAAGSAPRGSSGLTIVVRLLRQGDAELLWHGQIEVKIRKAKDSDTAPNLEQEVAELLAPLPDRTQR